MMTVLEVFEFFLKGFILKLHSLTALFHSYQVYFDLLFQKHVCLDFFFVHKFRRWNSLMHMLHRVGSTERFHRAGSWIHWRHILDLRNLYSVHFLSYKVNLLRMLLWRCKLRLRQRLWNRSSHKPRLVTYRNRLLSPCICKYLSRSNRSPIEKVKCLWKPPLPEASRSKSTRYLKILNSLTCFSLTVFSNAQRGDFSISESSRYPFLWFQAIMAWMWTTYRSNILLH